MNLLLTAGGVPATWGPAVHVCICRPTAPASRTVQQHCIIHTGSSSVLTRHMNVFKRTICTQPQLPMWQDSSDFKQMAVTLLVGTPVGMLLWSSKDAVSRNVRASRIYLHVSTSARLLLFFFVLRHHVHILGLVVAVPTTRLNCSLQ